MKASRCIRPILPLLLTLWAACDMSPAAPSGAGIASITISPPAPQVETGETVQLSPVVRDAAGNELPAQVVFWSSSDSTVASISPQGLLRGRTPGTARIAASAERTSDVITVVVLPRRVASVVIEPTSVTLTALTDTVRFTATARDAAGNPLPDRSITWVASETAVAAISSSGVATAVGNGVTTISAQAEGITGAATLTVAQRVARIVLTPSSVALSVGDTVRFSAVPLDANGLRVAGAAVSWGSSTLLVAPVNNTGLVTGASTGQATITASAEGVSTTATVAVALTPVGSVEVTPAAPVLRVGESTALSAVVRDERGNVLPGRVVTWTSGDPNIVAVASTGRVDAVAPGTAVVTASSAGKTGTATITVQPIALRAQITFTSRRDGNAEIYVMNPDRSGQSNLTNHPADDVRPAWSPDRTKIAFSSNRTGNWEIYLMNADGTGVSRLTNDPAEDTRPSWSPDGRQIAFDRRRDGNAAIYVVSVDGTGLRELTSAAEDNEGPTWSPDGTRIAFSSNRGGNWDIYVMNADGTGLSRLTNHPGFDGSASWSPDGSRIVFDSQRGGSWDIYLMNPNGSGLTRLTTSSGVEANYAPTWSPDGRQVAFTSNRDGTAQLYVINTDGTGVAKLTEVGANERPSWK